MPFMNKREYFEISRKQKEPKRCPIVGICERHAATVYFFKYHVPGDDWRPADVFQLLRREGEIRADFEEHQIVLRGEPPSFKKEDDYVEFANVCPEVTLFDANPVGFALAAPTATASAYWNQKQGVTRSESRHYTECLEFCAWSAARLSKSRRGANSDPVPPKLRAEIISLDGGKCFFTGQTAEQVELTVHHIITRKIIENLDLPRELFTAPYNLICVSASLNIAKSAKLSREDIAIYFERFSDPTHRNHPILRYLSLFQQSQIPASVEAKRGQKGSA